MDKIYVFGINDDTSYELSNSGRLINFATGLNKDLIFNDLYNKF